MRYLIPLFLVFLISCVNQTLGPIEINISTPLGLVGYSSNQNIVLKFWANNWETDFQGYNVYIDTNPNFPADQSTLLTSDGTPPTIQVSSYDKDTIFTYRISSFHNSSNLEFGKTYFIKLKSFAYNYQTGTNYSAIGNEIEVTIATSGSAVLNNQNISGQIDDGFDFKLITSVDCFDSPDSSNWTGDIFFELRASESSYYPYMTVLSNGVYIQDLGYYNSIYERYTLPEYSSGYNGDHFSVPLGLNHIYAIYDDLEKMYVRIFITFLPEAQTSETAGVTVSFQWSIQTNNKPYF